MLTVLALKLMNIFTLDYLLLNRVNIKVINRFEDKFNVVCTFFLLFVLFLSFQMLSALLSVKFSWQSSEKNKVSITE